MWTCRPYQRANKRKAPNGARLRRSRSKTGRKLVRVRAAATGEIVWETVISARTVESLPVVQEAIQAAEALLGLTGEGEEVQRKRARTEIRLDSSWGSEAMITWLLSRGSQLTGKFKSNGRVRKLVKGITTWSATSSPGREVAEVPEPVTDVASFAAIRGAHALQRAGQWLLPRHRLHEPRRAVHDAGRGSRRWTSRYGGRFEGGQAGAGVGHHPHTSPGGPENRDPVCR